MARLGTIDLLSRDGTSFSGAAFTLATAPHTDALLRFEEAEIEVRNGQRDAVVRFRGTTSALDTYQNGRSLVQQGLDLLSMLGRIDGVIVDAEDEHTLWWPEPTGLVVRLVATTTLRFGVGPVTVEVRDPQGNVVPPTPVVPRHHIGFRYYRLAQVTDDLYDAYRNMYLAFEVLLSSRFPKSKGERERDWLTRGLNGASADVRIADLVAPGTLNVVGELLNRIYCDARLPLFHAKQGSPFYAPQDSHENREVVAAALIALTHIVLRMAEAWFQTRRTGGGVYFHWVYQNAAEQLLGTHMVASADSSPFNASENDLTHHRFQDGLSLASRLAPELQRGLAPALLGLAEAADLARLPVLRRIDVASSDTPYAALLLESELALDGVGRLEAVAHFRAMNLNQPKSLFKT